ncbi:MAG TPA: DUF433 domain-containing protein [Longimicrobiaceae bacterium]|nr:DUF433 domain-containing protein [Longimicrobiaceae bacterium]
MSNNQRRSSSPGLSPREAAFATGLSEKTINQAIDREEVQLLPKRRQDERERMLGLPDLVYLRLRNDVGRLLSPEGKRKLRQQLGHCVRERQRPEVVTIGAVEVRIGPEVEAIEQNLERIEQARSFVTSDPEVRAGEPVVRGTRIPVHMLGDLAEQGASREELLEDYPALTPETLDAALLYARMYPRRGRPRRAPWKNGVVVRKAS